jgi:hypothetical protein
MVRSSISIARQAVGDVAEAMLILTVAAATIVALSLAVSGTPAGANSVFAAKGGNGHGGGNLTTSAGCIIDTRTVTASGLPTDEVINFFVSDANGKTGWVLGFTDDGTWAEPVPVRTGPTTYEFASRTWGPMGSHYTVFASCYAE